MNIPLIEPWIEADVGETVARMRQEGTILGSVCGNCGQAAYPPIRVCRHCQALNQVLRPLSHRGSLYSYTTVQVATGRAVPYSVGYVDLVDGVRVFAPLQISPAEVTCDLPVRLAEGPSGWAFEVDEELR